MDIGQVLSPDAEVSAIGKGVDVLNLGWGGEGGGPSCTSLSSLLS